MKIFFGKSICSGTAIGRIASYSEKRNIIMCTEISNVDSEIERFDSAKIIVREELKIIHNKAVEEIGEARAQIFEAHMMILDDEEFCSTVIGMIRDEHVNAEYAVDVVGKRISEILSQLDDEYLSARAVDIKEIADRLTEVLTGAKSSEHSGEISEKNDYSSNDAEPYILVAEELKPGEVISLNKKRLKAIITESCSVNSHTAIIARAMNIPAITGVNIEQNWNGMTAIVDGTAGELIVNPDETTFEKYRMIMSDEKAKADMANSIKDLPCVTESGKTITLHANAGSVSDIDAALENGAEGIGLFRTEFIYLGCNDYPNEEEQYKIYSEIVRKMAGKRVVFRTIDIGADKQADYFGLKKEDNPALGYRAIRICLDRKDIFKTQLRALYRASAYGDLSIMFPMIISLEEVREIKNICAKVEADLKEEGVKCGKVELGIMIETPAAVIISDILAKEVDFFSIGTNDLTQYTLAVDRQNPMLDKQLNTHHEAVLRMIKMVIDNGHASGCRVAICGELGADTSLTETFINMGIDELSVSVSALTIVKKTVREAN